MFSVVQENIWHNTPGFRDTIETALLQEGLYEVVLHSSHIQYKAQTNSYNLPSTVLFHIINSSEH